MFIKTNTKACSIYLQWLMQNHHMQNPKDWTVFYSLFHSCTVVMYAESPSYTCASECPQEAFRVLEGILGVMMVAR